MLEVFLFINPIGVKCREIEQRLLNIINHSEVKFQLRLVPLMNLTTVSDYIDSFEGNQNDLNLRNHLTNLIYQTAIDVKAAQMQGKKCGRDFLLKIQDEIGQKKKDYSEELVLDIFQTTSGDLEMFLEDRQSNFVKEAFLMDQQLAQEMAIQSHPSAVIFNCSGEMEVGVKAQGCEELELLMDQCESTKNLRQLFESHCGQVYQKASNEHLSLL